MKGRLLLLASWCLSTIAVGSPLYVGPDGTPLEFERTICGSNDMLVMLQQDAATQKLGEPIGILKGQSGGSGWRCSGTLIHKDLFLTARHCAGPCSGLEVTFGYLQRGRSETYRCKEIVEQGNQSSTQDYMIIRLDGDPGTKWGWYPPSDRDLQPGDTLMMIHHPGGKPMRLSLKDCKVSSVGGGMLRHRCDTEGGSSGGGILVPDPADPKNIRVVGVHAFGGCGGSGGTNSGPAVRDLVNLSPTLKSLATP